MPDAGCWTREEGRVVADRDRCGGHRNARRVGATGLALRSKLASVNGPGGRRLVGGQAVGGRKPKVEGRRSEAESRRSNH